MKKIVLSLVLFLFLMGCHKKNPVEDNAMLKVDILKTEKNFRTLSETKGIAVAFYTFADENAVIKREQDTLIEGKENIKTYYSSPKFKKAAVTWKPDFVAVSDDGTLAYTYGKYSWTETDSLGTKKEYKGRFHTVWKKQRDGSWKYVWD